MALVFKCRRVILNVRLSVRQGDKASMEWFTFGIDPLITYLEKRLQGILIHSLPVLGPLPPPPAPPLPPVELRYKLIAYCDDVKPAITSMQEFILVDMAMTLFEKSSGCKLHCWKMKVFGTWQMEGDIEARRSTMQFLFLVRSP